jgi:hypothetical protein
MTPRFGVGGNSERQQMKDSIAAFFERFDEMERLSRQHQISRQEAELRNRLGKEAMSIVVPSFAACCQRAQSKSLEKCAYSFEKARRMFTAWQVCAFQLLNLNDGWRLCSARRL